MRSRIFEGTLRHRRVRPVTHAFEYRVATLQIDLDEIDELTQAGYFARDTRWATVSFCRGDYGRDPSLSLADDVRAVALERTGRRFDGPVLALLNLRHFGYYFSPLNLYFCRESADGPATAIVAEVNNIPWRERHFYVLHEGNAIGADRGPRRYGHAKAFHVSPFMEMAYDYRWTVSETDDRLAVRLENVPRDASSGAEPTFDATLAMSARPLTRAGWTWTLLRYPWITGRMVAAIYWEALRLWLKNCPYIPHPKSSPSPAPTTIG